VECFGTTDFDNNIRLITLSAIIISGLHCIRCSAEGYAKAIGILNEEKEEYVEFKKKICDSCFFIFQGRVEETLSILKLLIFGYL
jgi:hypothetical protein